MWFSSELNGKDHLKRIHNFTEGRGYSFYDCLRQFGFKWFGRRTFFDQREVTGQGLWMDLALARKSGQELHNNCTITNSPALAQLRKLFCAAIRDLTSYENHAAARVEVDPQPSISDHMRRDMTQNSQEYTDPTDIDPASDIPVVESLSPLIISSATPPPVVDTPFRSITPNNRSLTYLQSGPFDLPQSYVPLARGDVSSVSLASTDLLCGAVTARPACMAQLRYCAVIAGRCT